MDRQTAERIYDVLVEVCGAPERERESFVYAYLGGSVREWRFQGRLGFGGKIYDDGDSGGRWPRFRVCCYPEDRTPEREEICGVANARLAEFERSLRGVG